MAFAMICALALVPTEDVVATYCTYKALVPTLPNSLLRLAEHVDFNYIRGKPLRNGIRRGKVRRALPFCFKLQTEITITTYAILVPRPTICSRAITINCQMC